ncbi:stage II sporulation protein M [Halovivax sp.]|uniref:stage II sporulation protein M n=1 Tax=Halovivax sp. TaxID=1935978 RepID=UPI0025C26391|nr:stage II sporulation protein M [Halovivax sp.]
MRLGAAVTAVGRVFRNRPSDLLPFYVLGAAVATIGQVTALAGVVLAYAYLAATGRTAALREELTALEEPPDADADPAAFEAWMDDLLAALEPALTPVIGTIFALTGIAFVTVVLVAYAAIGAGQLSACFARLRDERGLEAGVAGTRRHWPTFLGLYLLEFLLWIGITVAAVVLGGLGATLLGFGAIGAVVGVLLVALSVLGWIAAAISIRAVFAFAPVGVVVDRVGAARSVSNAAGFVRHNRTEAVFYYVVALAALFGVGALLSLLGGVGAGSATGLVFALFVLPALDLLKTTLYGGGRGAIAPPAPVERSLRGQFVDGLRRGWRELVAFVRATPGHHAAAALALVAGAVMGWVFAGPFVGEFEASIAGRLEGHVAPVAALEFFGNNWTVALTMAFGGVVLAIPALGSLWFNGLVLGIYGRLEAEPAELLAFVTPHGIFEIPAIFVAGAVGIFLGLSWWRTWRGPATRADLADDLERAFWVLVGVGILLAIAAVIEGFVSPYYWRPLL